MASTTALETVGDYITECRRLLQDEVSPYRYPDADIVDGLDIGLQEARRLRADLFLPLFDIPWFNSGGTIDTAALVPMDKMYRPAFVYYVIGRMQLRDDEATTDSRAGVLMNKFVSQMLTINS